MPITLSGLVQCRKVCNSLTLLNMDLQFIIAILIFFSVCFKWVVGFKIGDEVAKGDPTDVLLLTLELELELLL